MISKNPAFKTSLKQWFVIKYPLIALLITFYLLKVIIIQDIIGWNEETPRDVSLYIFPSQNTTIIFPQTLSESEDRKLNFLFVVTSGPSNFERRNAIRETWGSDNKSGLKTILVFLMGLTTDSMVLALKTKTF